MSEIGYIATGVVIGFFLGAVCIGFLTYMYNRDWTKAEPLYKDLAKSIMKRLRKLYRKEKIICKFLEKPENGTRVFHMEVCPSETRNNRNIVYINGRDQKVSITMNGTEREISLSDPEAIDQIVQIANEYLEHQFALAECRYDL